MPIITENEYTFTSANGSTPIHVREWVPDCDINAVVQISHGICEYAGRYAPFARYLASKGFVVVANDHLGHGQSVLSEEDLGYFGPLGSWETVVADIEQLRRLTAEKWPESPYFLLGHSMGSFLARTWLIRHPEVELAGVILSGTGQPAAPVLAAGRMLCDADVLKNGPRHRSLDIYGMAFGSYNKKIEPRRSPYDWLTRDEAVVDAYAADPLCTFTPTSSLFREMLSGLATVGSAREISRMSKDIPIILMSGDADPVGGWGVQVAKVYSLLVRAGCRDVAYKFYPGARHEILNETNCAEVYKDILDWLCAKIA
ncbi:MAG TPA: lysophospholipase [Candidatus Scatomorpha stercorigallinarum]|nr:lysophospholipase [Candidatus Scatomorpha stercorigallinarum]